MEFSSTRIINFVSLFFTREGVEFLILYKIMEEGEEKTRVVR